MDYGVNKQYNIKEWRNLYNDLPSNLRSPFFSPDFYQSYKEVENHPAECFWAYQDERNFLFYPYLKRSVNILGYDLDAEYYDLCGAYGYNGPMGIADDDKFIREYNSILQDYLISSNVVAEFVRYSPIPSNRQYQIYTDQIDVLDNVYLKLNLPLEDIWSSSFEYGVRKAIKKGISYGLSTTITTGIEVGTELLERFYSIYISTMSRNNADDFYSFSFEYFVNLCKTMGDKIILAATYLDSVMITTELVLIDGALAYGFLGGTLHEYYDKKPNTFQRYELIKYLKAKGIQSYSMGGGASRNDGIYQFKMSFARGCVNLFHIGKYVHNPAIYQQIFEQWKHNGAKIIEEYPAKILFYRDR